MWEPLLILSKVTLDSERGSTLSSPDPCRAGIWAVSGTELITMGMGVGGTELRAWEQIDICFRCKKRCGANVRRGWGGIIPEGNNPGLTGSWTLACPLLKMSPIPFLLQWGSLWLHYFLSGFNFSVFILDLRLYNRHPECSNSPSAPPSLWIVWEG